MERPVIDHDAYPGMEHRFTSAATTAELRAAGKRFPDLVESLDTTLQPLYAMLYERFEQLDLKGRPFMRGRKASNLDADTFFHEIKVNRAVSLLPTRRLFCSTAVV